MKNYFNPAQDMREKEALHSKIAEQAAIIDYLAMMAGIDLDDDSNEAGDNDGEE